MENFISWSEPLPFIETVDGELMINDDTADKLHEIVQPIIVVAITGSFRTGKSYLMNLIAGKQGFQLGSELQSKTKGIWVWCVQHPIHSDKVLVLIDTEGLDDPNKESGKKHDIMIFTLSVLLSSTLIFNTTGRIDQEMINKLHEIIENIKVHSETSNDEDEDYIEYSQYFPTFVLAVRDFMLELKLNGKDCTPDEYFNYVLKPIDGKRKQHIEYNVSREAIRSSFKRNHCFVFPRPVQDDDLFSDLQNLPKDALAPKFVQQLMEFNKFILDTSSVKKLQRGQDAIGCSFVTLAEAYVDSLNEGAVPCIESVLDYVTQTENERVIEEALALYSDKMNELKSSVSNVEFEAFHTQANTIAMDHFYKFVMLDNEREFFELCRGKLLQYCASCRDLNEKHSTEECKQVIKEIYQKIIGDKNFICSGGYQDYEKCINLLLSEYDAINKDQIKSEEVKNQFLKDQENDRKLIIAADNSLSKLEREVENYKKQAEDEALQLQVEEEKKRCKQEWLEQLQNEHDVETQKMAREYNKQEEMSRLENEDRIQTLLEKQKRELQEGHEREVAVLQQRISAIEERNATGDQVDAFLEKTDKVIELVSRCTTIMKDIGGAVEFFKPRKDNPQPQKSRNRRRNRRSGGRKNTQNQSATKS